MLRKNTGTYGFLYMRGVLITMVLRKGGVLQQQWFV